MLIFAGQQQYKPAPPRVPSRPNCSGVHLHKNKTNRRVNQMHPTTYNAKAYSAASDTSPLASTKIERRDPTDRDVQIEILFIDMASLKSE
jgi:hypothetical protein